MKIVLSALQVFACLVAGAAGLVPLFEYATTYRGAYATSWSGGAPHLHGVDAGSDADRDGFQVKDEILKVNGAPATFESFGGRLHSLRPGETATIRVKRGSEEIDIVAHGPEPKLAAVLYPDGTIPLAGGVCVALAMLIVATLFKQPTPLWRSILVIVFSLAAGTLFVMSLVNLWIFGPAMIKFYGMRDMSATWKIPQYSVGIAACVALAFLGAGEMALRGRKPAAE